MSRFKLVYRGLNQFTIVDLEKPQKGHPKGTYVPNGKLYKMFTTLEEAQTELVTLNGNKRKNKKQKYNPKRSSRNYRKVDKRKPMDQSRSPKELG
jgi:hypothetical protein